MRELAKSLGFTAAPKPWLLCLLAFELRTLGNYWFNQRICPAPHHSHVYACIHAYIHKNTHTYIRTSAEQQQDPTAWHHRRSARSPSHKTCLLLRVITMCPAHLCDTQMDRGGCSCHLIFLRSDLITRFIRVKKKYLQSCKYLKFLRCPKHTETSKSASFLLSAKKKKKKVLDLHILLFVQRTGDKRNPT